MTIRNALAAVLVLFFSFLLVNIGSVTSAPTWIPSNVTFERINETHVQVFYKEKLIETISVPEETTISQPQQQQLQPSPALQPPGQTSAGVKAKATKRPPPLDPLMIEQYKRQWMRINGLKCYFNPVTCFVGEKS